MEIGGFTREELVNELIRRENVWSREVIPSEHYQIVLRGSMVVHQNIGGDKTKILIVR